MDITHEGRQLALAIVNMDDLVLAGQLSSGSVSLLSFAGRSLVGTAVAGAGIATRAAVLGAQVATKSALAVAGAAKGTIPGAGLAEQMVYDLDQSVGRSGQTASFVASQGVAIGKAESRPPAEPIFGDPWLGKRLRPGATVGSVFMDSAVDLTRLAVLPLTLGTATLASAMASSAGQEVTRTFWNAFSSIVDGVAGRSASGGTNQDRSEQRAPEDPPGDRRRLMRRERRPHQHRHDGRGEGLRSDRQQPLFHRVVFIRSGDRIVASDERRARRLTGIA